MAKKMDELIVKTDKEVVEELRMYVDALIGKASEALARGLLLSVSFDNGEQSGKVELFQFRVMKKMDEYVHERVKQQRAQQMGPQQ